MRFISWKRVKSWKCIACGECCRYFNIHLRGIEYARLSKSYGSEVFDITKKQEKFSLNEILMEDVFFNILSLVIGCVVSKTINQ